MKANVFEVLELSATGTLTRPDRTFMMGRGAFGVISFTPDGEVGMLAQEDGSVGVFRIDAGGAATVVHAALTGEFYASRVVADPDGEHAWILDGNTRENGGGLYRATIGCDGSFSDIALTAPARLPGGVGFVGDHLVVAAGNILDSMTAGDDVHLLDLQNRTTPVPLDGADAFGDDAQIIGGTALTADRSTFLVGDTGNGRVAVVGVGATTITPAAKLASIADPQGIATSPFGNVAIVTSALGDAISILDDDGANDTWRIRGLVDYKGGKPQLPGDVAAIHAGMLDGHVLVSENVSIRHLAFRSNGTVEDLGSFPFGAGLQNIAGAIGVTP